MFEICITVHKKDSYKMFPVNESSFFLQTAALQYFIFDTRLKQSILLKVFLILVRYCIVFSSDTVLFSPDTNSFISTKGCL